MAALRFALGMETAELDLSFWASFWTGLLSWLVISSVVSTFVGLWMAALCWSDSVQSMMHRVRSRFSTHND